jgi:hypothetical protein
LGGLASSSVLYYQGDSVVDGSDLDHPFASMDFKTEPIAIIPTEAINFTLLLEIVRSFTLLRERLMI